MYHTVPGVEAGSAAGTDSIGSAARTIAELERQLEGFREHYNERRPHRALNRRTPGEAYRAFRGRDAGIDALMRDRGLAPEPA